MTRFHRWASTAWAVAALVGTPTHAATTPLQTLKQRGELVVGVKKDVPLWGMLNARTGELEGLEVDLARDLALQLGLRLKLVGVLTAERTPLLEARQVDLLIATVANTRDRQSQMTMVLPSYHASGTSVVARKTEGFRQWNDLRNRRICSRRDAYFNRPVAVKYGADIVALYSANHALEALRDGRCAGFLYGDTQISALLSDPAYQGRYEMALPPINLTPWVVVLHREDRDTDLHAAVSQGVVRWFRTGLVSQLQQKWGLPTPESTLEKERLWNLNVGGKPHCGTAVGPSTPQECL